MLRADEHVIDWKPGSWMHTHTDRCIKCNSAFGDTIIIVQVIRHWTGRLGIEWKDIGNRLCPECKDKYLPLTPGMHDELSRLSRKLQKRFMARGCPCCMPDVDWQPGNPLASEHHHDWLQ